MQIEMRRKLQSTDAYFIAKSSSILYKKAINMYPLCHEKMFLEHWEIF